VSLEEEVVGSNWPEIKPTCAFGQVPLFTVDGTFRLVQSNAIIRYLAREFNLYGKNNKEAALIDQLNDGVEDLRIKYVKLIYQNYEAGKAEYVANLPNELRPFEALLKSNNDGQGFVVGDEISFADYALFDILDLQEILAPGCLNAFPLLQAFHQRIASRPNIAAYRASDAFKKLPVNGNGKQ